ncbi:E3 ubiquitin-protein ligase MARCHF3-like isoform X2 [Palaemon carinicauda]|uniref:E3 ubiquitin-protein ligase MARCHF3-like isoform X2 n=1 Tax=Palaemon carinicauda TaxID=392227 RepID=UPI0035B5A4D0
METESHIQPCSTFTKRSLSESYLTDSSGSDFPYRKISVDDSYLILTRKDCVIKDSPLIIQEQSNVEFSSPDEAFENCQTTARSFLHSVNSLGINEFHPFALELSSNLEVAAKFQLGESSLNITMASCGPMCRICLEGDGQEELISPCKCSGTLALIHKTCLEKWLNLSSCDTCELCRYVFTLERIPKPFWQFSLCSNKELRRSLAIDFLCFLILTPLVALSLYLCVVTAVIYKNNVDELETEIPFNLEKSYWNAWNVQAILSDRRNGTAKTEDNPDKDGPKWDIAGLALLAVILIGIYLCWLVAACLRILKVWSLANQELVLSENHRRPSCFSVLSNSYRQMEEVDNHANISPVICPLGVIPRINVEDSDLQNHMNSINMESRSS